MTSSVTETFSSSIVESIATEASISTESLSETVTSTVIAATTTDVSSTLSTTATSADTTTLLTTETATAETTTATSEASAEPTGFFIVAGPGAALGKKLETSDSIGGPIIFNADRPGVFEPRRFVLDESTGRLQLNGMFLCARFGPNQKNVATITLCDTESYYYGFPALTCGQSAAPGSTLECSTAQLICTPSGPSSQRCTELATPDATWNGQFFIETLDGESYLSIGVDNLGADHSPVDLFVDFVEVEVVET